MTRKLRFTAPLLVVALAGVVSTAASGVTESARRGSPVKIAATLPLTGVAASIAQTMYNAELLAVSQINGSGGVKGHKLVLTVKDDQLSVATASTILSGFASDSSVLGVVGSYGSVISLPTSAQLEQAKVASVFPQAAAPQMTQRGFKYVFNLYPHNHDFVPYLNSGAIKPTRVALITYQNPGPLAEEARVKAWCEAHNVQIVYDQLVQPGQPSYADDVTKVKQGNPDLVWVFLSTPDTGTFVLNMVQQQLKPTWLWANESAYPIFRQQVGTHANGVLSDTFWWSTMSGKASRAFVDAYVHRYGIAPDGAAASAYQSVQILAQAIASAKGKITRTSVRAALASQRFQTITGVVKFDAAGQSNTDIPVTQNQGVSVVPLYPSTLNARHKKPIPWVG